MRMDQRLIGEITMIDIGGRLTVEDGADAFRDTARQLIRQGRIKLIVNFRDASYVDSTGLGEIVRAYTSVIRHGGSLKLLQVPPRILDLLVVTKLLSVFDLFDAEAEALRSFGDRRS